MASLARSHAKKFGEPIVIPRGRGTERLSIKDFHSQYSVVYSSHYEYSVRRRVRFSLNRNHIVAFERNSPPNSKETMSYRTSSLDTIALFDSDDEVIMENYL